MASSSARSSFITLGYWNIWTRGGAFDHEYSCFSHKADFIPGPWLGPCYHQEAVERVWLDASFVLLLQFLVHVRFAPFKFLIMKQPANVDTISIAILDPQIMLIIMGQKEGLSMRSKQGLRWSSRSQISNNSQGLLRLE